MSRFLSSHPFFEHLDLPVTTVKSFPEEKKVKRNCLNKICSQGKLSNTHKKSTRKKKISSRTSRYRNGKDITEEKIRRERDKISRSEHRTKCFQGFEEGYQVSMMMDWTREKEPSSKNGCLVYVDTRLELLIM